MLRKSLILITLSILTPGLLFGADNIEDRFMMFKRFAADGRLALCAKYIELFTPEAKDQVSKDMIAVMEIQLVMSRADRAMDGALRATLYSEAFGKVKDFLEKRKDSPLFREAQEIFRRVEEERINALVRDIENESDPKRRNELVEILERQLRELIAPMVKETDAIHKEMDKIRIDSKLTPAALDDLMGKLYRDKHMIDSKITRHYWTMVRVQNRGEKRLKLVRDAYAEVDKFSQLYADYPLIAAEYLIVWGKLKAIEFDETYKPGAEKEGPSKQKHGAITSPLDAWYEFTDCFELEVLTNPEQGLQGQTQDFARRQKITAWFEYLEILNKMEYAGACDRALAWGKIWLGELPEVLPSQAEQGKLSPVNWEEVFGEKKSPYGAELLRRQGRLDYPFRVIFYYKIMTEYARAHFKKREQLANEGKIDEATEYEEAGKKIFRELLALAEDREKSPNISQLEKGLFASVAYKTRMDMAETLGKYNASPSTLMALADVDYQQARASRNFYTTIRAYQSVVALVDQELEVINFYNTRIESFPFGLIRRFKTPKELETAIADLQQIKSDALGRIFACMRNRGGTEAQPLPFMVPYEKALIYEQFALDQMLPKEKRMEWAGLFYRQHLSTNRKDHAGLGTQVDNELTTRAFELLKKDFPGSSLLDDMYIWQATVAKDMGDFDEAMKLYNMVKSDSPAYESALLGKFNLAYDVYQAAVRRARGQDGNIQESAKPELEQQLANVSKEIDDYVKAFLDVPLPGDTDARSRRQTNLFSAMMLQINILTDDLVNKWDEVPQKVEVVRHKFPELAEERFGRLGFVMFKYHFYKEDHKAAEDVFVEVRRRDPEFAGLKYMYARMSNLFMEEANKRQKNLAQLLHELRNVENKLVTCRNNVRVAQQRHEEAQEKHWLEQIRILEEKREKLLTEIKPLQDDAYPWWRRYGEFIWNMFQSDSQLAKAFVENGISAYEKLLNWHGHDEDLQVVHERLYHFYRTLYDVHRARGDNIIRNYVIEAVAAGKHKEVKGLLLDLYKKNQNNLFYLENCYRVMLDNAEGREELDELLKMSARLRTYFRESRPEHYTEIQLNHIRIFLMFAKGGIEPEDNLGKARQYMKLISESSQADIDKFENLKKMQEEVRAEIEQVAASIGK